MIVQDVVESNKTSTPQPPREDNPLNALSAVSIIVCTPSDSTTVALYHATVPR
jgi:hypothetical protein